MVLGGAEKSRPLLRYAVEHGYGVVLCDRSEDAPCRSLCSRFEKVSTTEFEGLLDVARRNAVDGVVSFGSDVMAMVAARLARELSLPGNPPDAVETLIRKDWFRQFLVAHGFNAPRSLAADRLPDREAFEKLTLPVMVKPVDGAGSTAVSRVDDWDALERPFEAAREASRDNHVVIEEYLERDHPFMIGGDIFVERGEVIFWGLLNSHRSNPDRPFLPTGTSYPLELSEARLAEVRSLLQALVSKLGISFGGLNVEVMYTADGRPFIIELAPRNGGNRIPELLHMATGFDLFGALVKAALGRPVSRPLERAGENFMSNYMLQADRPGTYRDLEIDDELRPHVRELCMDVEPGDTVQVFARAPDALGTIFFEFADSSSQQSLLSRLPDLITISIDAHE
jgi:biotin carboxylase